MSHALWRRIRSSIVMNEGLSKPSSYARNFREASNRTANPMVYLPCLEALSGPSPGSDRSREKKIEQSCEGSRSRRRATADVGGSPAGGQANHGSRPRGTAAPGRGRPCAVGSPRRDAARGYCARRPRHARSRPRSPTLLLDRAATWVPAPLGRRGGRSLGPAGRAGRSGPRADWTGRRAGHRQLGDGARRDVRRRRPRRRPSPRRPTVRPRCSPSRWPAAGAASAALVALDPVAATRPPRPGVGWQQAVDALLEPAALALDNALRLQPGRSAVGHRRPDRPVQLALPQPGAAPRNQARLAQRPAAVAAVHRPRRVQVASTTRTATSSAAAPWSRRRRSSAGSARETDIVARFGGDEFAVVLPDTGGEGAFAVGERVRERVAAFTFLARRRPARPPDRLGRGRHAARRRRIGRGAGPGRRQGDVPGQGSGKNGIQAAAAPADN